MSQEADDYILVMFRIPEGLTCTIGSAGLI